MHTPSSEFSEPFRPVADDFAGLGSPLPDAVLQYWRQGAALPPLPGAYTLRGLTTALQEESCHYSREEEIVDLAGLVLESPTRWVLDGQRLHATPWAARQLLTLLGLPPLYFLEAADPRLLAPAVAWYLTQHPAKASRLRLWVPEEGPPMVGAVLSPAYAPLDNEPFLQAVETVTRLGDWPLAWSYRSDRKLVARIRAPKALEPFGGAHLGRWSEGLFYGIELQNSEFGDGAAVLASFVWREVCTNGLMLPRQEWTFSRVHRGSPERLMEELQEALRREEWSAPDPALLRVIGQSQQIALPDAPESAETDPWAERALTPFQSHVPRDYWQRLTAELPAQRRSVWTVWQVGTQLDQTYSDAVRVQLDHRWGQWVVQALRGASPA